MGKKFYGFTADLNQEGFLLQGKFRIRNLIVLTITNYTDKDSFFMMTEV